MNSNGHGPGSENMPGQSGLTPEHRVALSEAAAMIGQGQSHEAAVDHLVANGMPRLVAKVLVKQYDKTPNQLSNSTPVAPAPAPAPAPNPAP